MKEVLLQMDLSLHRRRLVKAFFEDGFKSLKEGLLVFLQGREDLSPRDLVLRTFGLQSLKTEVKKTAFVFLHLSADLRRDIKSSFGLQMIEEA